MSFINRAVVTAGVIVMVGGVSQVQAAPSQQPNVFVQQISDKLVKRLETERSAYQKDPKVLYRIVEDNLKPHADMSGFALRVMGKYATQATPAQKKTFAKTLEASLINTYSKFLGEFSNPNYTVLPYIPSKVAGRATVIMNFKTDAGKNVLINYLLVDKNNTWKVQDVAVKVDKSTPYYVISKVLGSQFAASVEQKGMDYTVKNFATATDAVAKK